MVQDRPFWFLTLEFYPQTQVVIDYECMDYHIVQNFWGSKFSQMAVFEHFVEIISWIRCQQCARRIVNVVWAWHTGKFYLIRTVHTVFRARTLASVSKAMPTLNVYTSLESVPCRFGSIAPGCCLLTLLHVETVVYVRVEKSQMVESSQIL